MNSSVKTSLITVTRLIKAVFHFCLTYILMVTCPALRLIADGVAYALAAPTWLAAGANRRLYSETATVYQHSKLLLQYNQPHQVCRQSLRAQICLRMTVMCFELVSIYLLANGVTWAQRCRQRWVPSGPDPPPHFFLMALSSCKSV